MRRTTVVAAALAALAALGAAPAQATFPGKNGRIYFDTAGQIVSANADGSARRTLDVGLANAASPDMSPDGTKFAFRNVQERARPEPRPEEYSCTSQGRGEDVSRSWTFLNANYGLIWMVPASTRRSSSI